jgi:hypothetical protein
MIGVLETAHMLHIFHNDINVGTAKTTMKNCHCNVRVLVSFKKVVKWNWIIGTDKKVTIKRKRLRIEVNEEPRNETQVPIISTKLPIM